MTTMRFALLISLSMETVQSYIPKPTHSCRPFSRPHWPHNLSSRALTSIYIILSHISLCLSNYQQSRLWGLWLKCCSHCVHDDIRWDDSVGGSNEYGFLVRKLKSVSLPVSSDEREHTSTLDSSMTSQAIVTRYGDEVHDVAKPSARLGFL